MHFSNSEYIVNLSDLASTQTFANSLAELLQAKLIIHLNGEMGAGKTTLVAALLKAIGVHGAVKSPTYTLVETYKSGGFTIHHFDLYRLTDPAELDFIGIRDYLNSDAICIFEWPQQGQGYIPTADLCINIELADEQRTVLMTANTELGGKVLTKLRAAHD